MLKRKTLQLGTVIVVLFLALVIFLNTTSAGQVQKTKFSRWLNILYYRIDNTIFSTTAGEKSVITLDIPLHYQEHSLSCEIAALKMALNYLGVTITEGELINKLRFDTTSPRSADNVWGDPEKGFVGSIDGSMPRTGYGVYEVPITNIASEYKKALPLKKADLKDILQAVFEKKAVIVWGYTGSGAKVSWKTTDGQEINAVFGEHARIIAGFGGTVDNPTHIWLLDPIYGKIHMSKKQFLANWNRLENRAVIIY